MSVPSKVSRRQTDAEMLTLRNQKEQHFNIKKTLYPTSATNCRSGTVVHARAQFLPSVLLLGWREQMLLFQKNTGQGQSLYHHKCKTWEAYTLLSAGVHFADMQFSIHLGHFHPRLKARGHTLCWPSFNN